MPFLSLRQAQCLLNSANSAAEKQEHEVAIAIVDGGGHLLLFQRSNTVFLGAISAALDKAVTANAYQRPTSDMQVRLNEGKLSYLALRDSLPMEGGVPVKLGGVHVGAIGISGAPSEIDNLIANEAVLRFYQDEEIVE